MGGVSVNEANGSNPPPPNTCELLVPNGLLVSPNGSTVPLPNGSLVKNGSLLPLYAAIYKFNIICIHYILEMNQMDH